MCGIQGAFFRKGDRASTLKSHFDKLSEPIKHRGPDDLGFFVDDFVYLGHRRLSIFDLSPDGHQPMFDETKRYSLVYNGEIFNFKELKNELIAHGIKFNSQSDTEVLLQLLIQKGQAALHLLNGFFAFAFYDSLEKKMLIARDRMGIKPLYFYADENLFYFASEMKGLTSLDLPRDIQNESIQTYFQLTYIPAPKSIYKNIFKLNPGELLTIDLQKIETKKYYHLPIKPSSEPNLSKKLKDLLNHSIELRLQSDVPIGAFLSGGLDSSILVALASQMTKNLNTFSVGFKENSYFDESQYALQVAGKYQTNHHQLMVDNEMIFSEIDSILNHLDEPFADASAIPYSILCGFAKKHVSVALSGDGADELFGGYNKHRAELLSRKYASLKFLGKIFLPLLRPFSGSSENALSNTLRKTKRFLSSVSLHPDDRYLQWCQYNDPKRIKKLLINYRSSDHLKNYLNFPNLSLNDVLYNDQTLVLPNDMLYKVDLMSMRHSLEVRVPFLDYRIVELANSLPLTQKISSLKGKVILREEFGHLLPKSILDHPKTGFSVPLASFFEGPLKDKILKNYLDLDFIDNQKIFSLPEIKKIRSVIVNNQTKTMIPLIWSLVVFQHWYQKTQNT